MGDGERKKKESGRDGRRVRNKKEVTMDLFRDCSTLHMVLSTEVKVMFEESKGKESNASLCFLRADVILCVDRNVLYCSLHYTVIHCTVLLCIVLYCSKQYYSTLHYTAMHCTVLYCTQQYHHTLLYPALP
jgi:hypothetical protein